MFSCSEPELWSKLIKTLRHIYKIYCQIYDLQLHEIFQVYLYLFFEWEFFKICKVYLFDIFGGITCHFPKGEIYNLQIQVGEEFYGVVHK